jgi:glucose uptake protein GlcU
MASSSISGGSSVLVGIVGVLIASLFWGSNFIACKGYNMGDGMHFSLLMATGILLVGILTLFAAPQENGDFEVVFSPEGLVGGSIWAFGNFLTVPIVKHIGLGMGLAIWAGVNLVVAFVVGAVGMGSLLPKETLANPSMGVMGILSAVVALVLFAHVKPFLSEGGGGGLIIMENEEMQVPLLLLSTTNAGDGGDLLLSTTNTGDGDDAREVGDDYSSIIEERVEIDEPLTQRQAAQEDIIINNNAILGIAMATLAGICYGFMFVPLSIWNQKVKNAGHIFDHDRPSETIQALRFFFSQFAGIFVISFLGFTVYCLLLRNKPLLVPPEAIMPSISSGIMWAIGCGGAMLATSGLGNTVGFPLVLNMSFLVNSSWSILYFGEIRGRKNFILFGVAFVFNILSSILLSLSKG